MSTRPLTAAALAGLIALASAGCGSQAATTTARTSPTTRTNAAAAQPLTRQEKAVKFAECMRANGVPHFPDPQPNGDYAFGVDVPPKVFTRAVDACKALKPPGALSSKRTPKQQSDGVRFAQCVRAHGVRDFPDPVEGQPLIDTTKIPSSNRPGGMTILDAAIKTCGHLLHLAAGSQG